MTAEGRRTVRAERSRPLVTALEAWLREHRARLSAKSEVAKAIDYLLKRWPSFAGLSGGRAHLPVQQCGGTGHPGHCRRKAELDLRRLGRGWAACSGDLHPDRDRQTQ